VRPRRHPEKIAVLRVDDVFMISDFQFDATARLQSRGNHKLVSVFTVRDHGWFRVQNFGRRDDGHRDCPVRWPSVLVGLHTTNKIPRWR